MTEAFYTPSDCCLATGDGFRVCQLCAGPLEINRSEQREHGHRRREQTSLVVCSLCGWWSLQYSDDILAPEKTITSKSSTFAIMSECRLGDKDLVVTQLQHYLASHFDDVYDIHPRKLEELTREIFRDHGFEVALTAYSGDGGLDLVFRSSKDVKPTAVQVKRHKKSRSVGVEEIHQFLGALMVAGISQGVFVTTSRYTRGAKRVALDLSSRSPGVDLSLLDFNGLKEIVADLTDRPADPFNAAWSLRNNIPQETDMYGDLSFSSSEWPRTPPSSFHVDWWISQYRAWVRQEDRVSSEPHLPFAWSETEVYQVWHSLAAENDLEITYITNDGLGLDSMRLRPKKDRDGVFMVANGRSGFGRIVDIRAWKPRPGFEVFELRGELGEIPSAKAWPPEPVIWTSTRGNSTS